MGESARDVALVSTREVHLVLGRLRDAIAEEWAKRHKPAAKPYRLRDAARDLGLVGAAAVYFGAKIVRAAWRERR